MEDICNGYDNTVYDSPGEAVRKQASNLHNNISEIFNYNDNINIIIESLSIKELTPIFSAFSSHKTFMSQSTNMKGFASRYYYRGFIRSIDIFGVPYSSEETCVICVQLLTGDFSKVIAQSEVTVTSDEYAKVINIMLDKDIYLDGDFYISVQNISENGYFRIEDRSSTYSTKTTEYYNKYLQSTSMTWVNTVSDYDMDIVLYEAKYSPKNYIKNIIYIGNQHGCNYNNIQTAIDSIVDDNKNNHYILYIMPGTYSAFSMVYNSDRSIRRTTPRYISIIGIDVSNTIIFDNRGNYDYPPAEIWTNGVIKNLSFMNKTDSEHHTQVQNRSMGYAVHSDFGTCQTRFENCIFYSNAGPGIGIGTWRDELIEFYNCRFIADGDGTFGDMGHGAFFCHTSTQNNATNQKLIGRDCISIADKEPFGARLAIISGYTGGTYQYELQNFGSFGKSGASVSLTDDYETLLSPYCFNNTPSILNK